jgi:nucleoid DNA-binding protein
MHYDLVGMKKEQVARRLAKESRITEGAAADQMDRILSDLRKKMRKGLSASLPGLGTFRPGRKQDFQFDPDPPTITPPPKPKKESK